MKGINTDPRSIFVQAILNALTARFIPITKRPFPYTM